MNRWYAFNFAVALSLVVSACFVCLWIRSAIVGDHPSVSIRCDTEPEPSFLIFDMFSNRAGLSFQVERRYYRPAKMGENHWCWRQRTYWDWHSYAPPGGRRDWLGFAVHRMPLTRSDGSWTSAMWRTSVWCQHWSAVAVAMLLPLVALWRHGRILHRRSRARKGLCPACGYDLRASKERCPECGADVMKTEEVSTN